MPIRIASIVEGDGEVEAFPILVRRLTGGMSSWVDIKRPNRIARSKLIKAGELERSIRLAAAQVGRQGGIVVVLDSDDDAACEFGPQLAERAKGSIDLPVSVTLACREWECWYIGAAKSLAGKCGLRTDLEPPVGKNPEEIRGAKEWLTKHMAANPKGFSSPYSPSIDQARMADAFDLDEARICSSFRRFDRELLRLCHECQARWPE